MKNLPTSPNSSNQTQNNLNPSQDWQKYMASLVGFEDELIDAELNIDTNINPQISENPLSQQLEKSPTETDNQQAKTRKSLSSNPFTKVAFVGGGTLIIVVSAGIFLSQIMGGNNQSSVSIPQLQNTPEPQPTQLNPQAQIEVLKTKLALSEQAKAVKSAQIQLRTLQPSSATAKSTSNNPTSASSANLNTQTRPNTWERPQTPPRVIVQRVPTPTQTVYVPRIVTVEKEKIVRVPQLVTSPPETQTKPQQNPSLTPTPTPSPTVKPTPIVTNTTTQSFPRTNRFIDPEEDLDASPQPTTTPTNTPSNNITPSLRTTHNNRKTVPVGTSVKGVLAIALFGESQKSPSTSSNTDHTFVIRLSEPLKTRDGNIALPKNTEILTQISNISDSGMVQLQVKSAIINENNNSRQITLSQASMRISAPQGKPLIAEQYPKRGSAIAGMDAGLFILGGIGKVAELSNRTDSEIITTAGGNIVSQNNPRTNILTGALEGGMNSIVPQITARNQQAISEMMRRGNIWFIPAGKKVEIFVNQQLQF